MASASTQSPPLVKPNGELARFYTLGDLVAAGYGDRSTLYKLIHERNIPTVQTGGKGMHRVCETDLHLFVSPAADAA